MGDLHWRTAAVGLVTDLEETKRRSRASSAEVSFCLGGEESIPFPFVWMKQMRRVNTVELQVSFNEGRGH